MTHEPNVTLKTKKIKNYKIRINKITTICLLIILTFSNIVCMKHVAVPLDAKTVADEKIIDVRLKSGEKRRVKNPKLQEEYFVGVSGRKEIRILLTDIESVESVRPDIKKFFIFYGISLVTLTILYLAFVPTDLYLD